MHLRWLLCAFALPTVVLYCLYLRTTGRVEDFIVPFYIYDEPELDPLFDCVFRTEQSSKFNRGEVYAYSQLRYHKWRVYNPDSAVLYVVPLYLGMHSNCKLQMHYAMNAIMNLPHYQRHYGWDHLVIGDYWYTHLFVGQTVPGIANFTLGGMGCLPSTTFRCTVTIPKTTQTQPREPFPGALSSTVEEYMSQKKYNLFFQGRTEGREAYKVRRLAMQTLGPVFAPSLIASVQPKNDTNPSAYESCAADQFDSSSIPPTGEDAFTAYKDTDSFKLMPTTSGDNNKDAAADIYASYNAYYRTNKSAYNKYNTTRCLSSATSSSQFSSLLRKSIFNLHLRGDDFTSSRLYDALSSGIPSITVANNLHTCGLPFGCMVPWRDMTINVDEMQFINNPVTAISEAVESYLPPIDAHGHPLRNEPAYARLQSILTTMNKHIQDVLWEVPHSRVATNLLIDTARKCLPTSILSQRGLHKDAICPFSDEAYDCDNFASAVDKLQLII